MGETRKGNTYGSRTVKAPTLNKAKPASSASAAPSGTSVVVSSAASAGTGATAPQRAPDTSHDTAQQPQPRTYAQASQGPVKRPAEDSPASFRPPVERGVPTFRVDDWELLERPAPRTIDRFVLYADLRSSQLPTHDVLLAIHQSVGSDVVGLQVYAAQKVVSLAFATEQLFRKYSNKRIADTDLVLYPVLPDLVFLQKLTLQGCPTSDRVAVTTAIWETFKQYGDVACVVPMVHVGTGWCTDTFHLTLRVPSADAPLPPPQLALFDDITITVDAPGRRRFCKFCNSDKHTRYDCRQGQRQRATTKANKQKEAAFLHEQAAESSDDDTLADDTSRSEETEQEQEVTETTSSPTKSSAPWVLPRTRKRSTRPWRTCRLWSTLLSRHTTRLISVPVSLAISLALLDGTAIPMRLSVTSAQV